jgi:hypothetical protein
MPSFSRRYGRELALQALYGTEVGKRSPDELLTELLARDRSSEGRASAISSWARWRTRASPMP